MAYKFRCSVLGHEKDVRSVSGTVFPDGGIVSGSRDVTARIWTPNEGDPGFTEAHVMSGHSNFVSCVCVVPPDEQYPQGLILTGSHDNSIMAFTLDSPNHVYKLTGHNDTVCALAAGKFGSLISGSWDKTAKVWLKEKCVMTLTGHEAAVWAVAIMPEGGFMLTGSADRSIRMWRAGKSVRTYTGHDDCVRGLAVLSTSEFLSCSNDATVKRWLTSGACTNTYYGHTNFVYSLAALPNGEDFVSTSEDRALKVWVKGECVQTITHPTTSVWCVTVLQNGDLVTGGSDGIIRVFTKAAERMADPEVQKMFEDELAQSSIPTQVGDLNVDQLQGPEALYNPGKTDGQTIMIKDKGQVLAHQWNASEGRWVKIGDVVGGSGGTQQTSGKQLFEGKEYDYVFDVELTEGRPALKLPYNTGEDPWMAAHNWLQKNELSPMFLDQVANFIQDQTKGVTLGQQAPPPEFSDPFTGAGRYVPGSGSAAPSQPNLSAATTRGGSDPFTGAGRYVPGGGQTQNPAGTLAGTGGMKSIINTFFPKTSCITFDAANSKAILGKLKEFNQKVSGENQVAENHIEAMEELMSGEKVVSQNLETLWKILHWPQEYVFPCLDVLRLTIRFPAVNQHFCNSKDGQEFLQFLLNFLSTGGPDANVMLTLRTLTNIFSQDQGMELMMIGMDRVLSAILHLNDNANKNIRIASSSVVLNYAAILYKNRNPERKAQCLNAVELIAQTQVDHEANFRLLVCFGTLIQNDSNCTELAKSSELSMFVNKCLTVSDPSKLHECAKFVADILKL